MPLDYRTREDLSARIRTLRHEGYPQLQAVAIAHRQLGIPPTRASVGGGFWTPDTVLDYLERVNGDVIQTDAAITACASIRPAVRNAWVNWRENVWKRYYERHNSPAEIAQRFWGTVVDELDERAARLKGWKDALRKEKCGLDLPESVYPRPTFDLPETFAGKVLMGVVIALSVAGVMYVLRGGKA